MKAAGLTVELEGTWYCKPTSGTKGKDKPWPNTDYLAVNCVSRKSHKISRTLKQDSDDLVTLGSYDLGALVLDRPAKVSSP